MTIECRTLFWLGTATLLVLTLYVLSDILLPFVLGAAIAYLLDPLADRLERAGLSRLWATIVITAAFLVIVIAAFLFLVPLLMEQLANFAARLPGYVQSARDLLLGYAEEWLGDSFSRTESTIRESLTDIIQRAAGWMGQLLGSVWNGGLAVVNALGLMLVTPVVTFYLLLDWDRMVEHVDQWLPRDHAPTIRAIAREIDEVLSGFVRGQLTVLFLLGCIYVIGLTLIGLNFALLIGVTAGLISFIPFVGPIVGFVVGGIVALVQFGSDWVSILGVLGVFVFGQFIEGNLLSPLIVGDRVRLHPLWLIFALFVFAYFFGFVGMLLAVPAAAAIGVLVRFALRKYLESPLYLGRAAASPAPAARKRGRKK